MLAGTWLGRWQGQGCPGSLRPAPLPYLHIPFLAPGNTPREGCCPAVTPICQSRLLRLELKCPRGPGAANGQPGCGWEGSECCQGAEDRFFSPSTSRTLWGGSGSRGSGYSQSSPCKRLAPLLSPFLQGRRDGRSCPGCLSPQCRMELRCQGHLLQEALSHPILVLFYPQVCTGLPYAIPSNPGSIGSLSDASCRVKGTVCSCTVLGPEALQPRVPKRQTRVREFVLDGSREHHNRFPSREALAGFLLLGNSSVTECPPKPGQVIGDLLSEGASSWSSRAGRMCLPAAF